MEGPSAALSVAEQDPLLRNRLKVMTTAMAALLRAALPAPVTVWLQSLTQATH